VLPDDTVLPMPRDVSFRDGVALRREGGTWRPWPVLRLDGVGARQAVREVAASRETMPRPAPPAPAPPMTGRRAHLVAVGLLVPGSREDLQGVVPWGRRAQRARTSDDS